ncbi:MAG: TIGR03557 family F420-dependent LLM class oxidoreductase [Rhodospirillales bacterium]|nr:TIGR03557 family F420-dependent LLM class oxidoreductase [Rhodospirillales bacterium]
MSRDRSSMPRSALQPDRRDLLRWSSMLAMASGVGGGFATAQAAPTAKPEVGGLRRNMIGYMLAHEQFPAPEILRIGAQASQAGFDVLATSDHFQPWQANQGHSSMAWVTMGALGAQTGRAWMGTTVTCPTFRYTPAVVAEGFASLAHLYPGRVFLGVGSGEALNEQAATGTWPKWQERWDRLIEAMSIIRALWSGQDVAHKGRYYTVNARLYDPPPQPIPLLAAANGKKSMRLAGQHADGLVTDPATWKQYKQEWQDGAASAGKDPSQMPVLVEHYVVVGDKQAARQAAELWRFGPQAFKTLYNVRDPAEIQRRAEAGTPIEKVMERWTVSSDANAHLDAVHELFASGVTIVNTHSGQADQRKVVDFYGEKVIPKFG